MQNSLPDNAIIVHILFPFISVSCTSCEKEKIIEALGFEKVMYEEDTYFEKRINRDNKEEQRKELLYWLKEFIKLDALLVIGDGSGGSPAEWLRFFFNERQLPKIWVDRSRLIYWKTPSQYKFESHDQYYFLDNIGGDKL